MSGLVLKLKPFEELLVNGVLLENGERNTRLRVKTEGAHILRLRDALQPEEATTPVKRAYYIAQLAVSGQIATAEAAAILDKALAENPDFGAGPDLHACVAAHDFYKLMRRLRPLAMPERSERGAGGDGRPQAMAAAG